jgi:hypothetical protein
MKMGEGEMDGIFNAPVLNVAIICSAVIIISVMIFLFLRNRNLTVGAGDKKISISRDGEVVEHDEHFEYLKYKIFSLQMDMADPAIKRIINLMLNVYQLELERIKDDVTRSDEFINYSNFMVRIYNLIKDEMKRFFKKNGFSEMDKEIFDKEKKVTADNIIDAINAEMVYYPGKIIGKKEWDILFSDKINETMYETLKDICDSAKKISEQGK